MSTTEKNPKNNDDNQSVHINNPVKIFLLALLFLVISGFVMFYIESNTDDLRSGKMRSMVSAEEGVASRLQPVAKFALLVVEKDAPLKTGQQVYDAACTTCHATGVAGAPVFGSKDAWAPYIATGYDEMLKNAMNGKGAMPAKGGNPSLKDIELARAVVYMTNASGANYPEPAEEGATAAVPADEAKTEVAAAAEPASAPEAADNADNGIPAATAEQLATGKAIYDTACFACHATGVAGAPTFGSKEAWAPYIETGLDTMLQIAIAGKGAMPPRGTAMNASDDELRATILYMIEDVR